MLLDLRVKFNSLASVRRALSRIGCMAGKGARPSSSMSCCGGCHARAVRVSWVANIPFDKTRPATAKAVVLDEGVKLNRGEHQPAHGREAGELHRVVADEAVSVIEGPLPYFHNRTVAILASWRHPIYDGYG